MATTYGARPGGQTYEAPDIKAPELVPSGQRQELKPETPVVIRHRGGPVLTIMCDGKQWEIPPGQWTVPYGVAKHLQRKAVVPGTRNVVDGRKTKSFIGILGLDQEDRCRPFTEAELQRITGGTGEALDRSGMVGDVVAVEVSAAIAEAYARGRDAEAEIEATKPDIQAPGLSAVEQAARDESDGTYVDLAAAMTQKAEKPGGWRKHR